MRRMRWSRQPASSIRECVCSDPVRRRDADSRRRSITIQPHSVPRYPDHYRGPSSEVPVVFFPESEAFAEDHPEDQTRSSAEVMCTTVPPAKSIAGIAASLFRYAVHQTCDAPDHVGHREVHEEASKCSDEGSRSVAESSGSAQRIAPTIRSGSDDREHQLVHREDVVRKISTRYVRVRGGIDALHEEKLGSAKVRTVEVLTEKRGLYAECPPSIVTRPAHPKH